MYHIEVALSYLQLLCEFMIDTIITSKSAEDIIKKWKKSNPKLFKKYQKIYHELVDHPRTVPGKFLAGM